MRSPAIRTTRAGSVDYGRPGWVVGRPDDRLDTEGEHVAFQVTDVQKALKGIDYPASPDDLAARAESNGASRDLVETLRGLRKKNFDGPNAVMQELKGQLTGSR
jgi:Protein of unknown function (DUF2795)